MDTLGEGRLPQSLGLGESRVPHSSLLSIAAGFVIVSGSLYLLTASWSPEHAFEAEPSTPPTAMSAAETETETLLDVTLTAREAEADADDDTGPAEISLASHKPAEPIAPSASQTPDATATFGVVPITEAEPIEAETIISKSTVERDGIVTPEDVPEIPALPETAATESADLETPVAAETTAPATDQIGQLIAGSPTRLVSTQTIREDTGDIPDRPVEVSAAPSGSTDSADAAASSETTAAVTPRAPTPKRESPAAQQTARSTPASKPAERKQKQARPAVAHQEQARNGLGFRLPMGLAPAKPVTAPASKPRLSGAAYSRQVWAALARSKPRAGQKGSATVVFSIGAGGSVGSARIARSSGNSRIDQLALSTVRRAAFPAPPSGRASFSIRIDFQ
jgi:protein TonB